MLGGLDLRQRASAARRDISVLCSGVSFAARATPPLRPPLRPRATACGSLRCFARFGTGCFPLPGSATRRLRVPLFFGGLATAEDWHTRNSNSRGLGLQSNFDHCDRPLLSLRPSSSKSAGQAPNRAMPRWRNRGVNVVKVVNVAREEQNAGQAARAERRKSQK
jgi:hypothetical protein